MADNRSFGPAGTEQRGPIGTVDNHAADDAPVIEESLVEEVSIDGMCGVY
ncbi:mycofactocin precursor MftA [Nocardia sp. NPDC024068]